MNRINLLVGVTGVLVSTGCNSAITDYVNAAKPPSTIAEPGQDPITDPGNTPAPPVQNASDPMAIKVSPGHVRASGPGISMEATVSPTQTTLSAGDVSAVISINRTRVSQ